MLVLITEEKQIIPLQKVYHDGNFDLKVMADIVKATECGRKKHFVLSTTIYGKKVTLESLLERDIMWFIWQFLKKKSLEVGVFSEEILLLVKPFQILGSATAKLTSYASTPITCYIIRSR